MMNPPAPVNDLSFLLSLPTAPYPFIDSILDVCPNVDMNVTIDLIRDLIPPPVETMIRQNSLCNRVVRACQCLVVGSVALGVIWGIGQLKNLP